jgi:hypothetical protein
LKLPLFESKKIAKTPRHGVQILDMLLTHFWREKTMEGIPRDVSNVCSGKSFLVSPKIAFKHSGFYIMAVKQYSVFE